MAATKHHKSRAMLFVFVLAFFILLSLAGFLISIRPPRITSNASPADFGLRYEEVSFPTTDGLELKGWYIPNRGDQAKTVILLHGYPADKGDILPVLSFLSAHYNLLLFDFRYLGQSQGRISTIGGEGNRRPPGRDPLPQIAWHRGSGCVGFLPGGRRGIDGG